MKIGIPNILPSIGFILSSGFLAGIIYVFDPQLLKDTGYTIAIIMAGIPTVSLTGIILYRFKVLILYSSQVFLIRPFRLSAKSILISDISSMNWQLWATHKLGDYRQIVIATSDDQFEFSDLEFANFNSLQNRLIDKLTFEPDLNQKRTIEITQANSNIWINRISIAIIGFFLILLLITVNLSEPNPKKLLVISVPAFIIYRLTKRLKEYKAWSSKYREVRRRRHKTLKERKKRKRN
ncbi:MAG: hypothetical protein NXI20_01660 [bacterium]|nr:hypothetical protein [bacterium]